LSYDLLRFIPRSTICLHPFLQTLCWGITFLEFIFFDLVIFFSRLTYESDVLGIKVGLCLFRIWPLIKREVQATGLLPWSWARSWKS